MENVIHHRGELLFIRSLLSCHGFLSAAAATHLQGSQLWHHLTSAMHNAVQCGAAWHNLQKPLCWLYTCVSALRSSLQLNDFTDVLTSARGREMSSSLRRETREEGGCVVLPLTHIPAVLAPQTSFPTVPQACSGSRKAWVRAAKLWVEQVGWKVVRRFGHAGTHRNVNWLLYFISIQFAPTYQFHLHAKISFLFNLKNLGKTLSAWMKLKKPFQFN